jgi:hypothetical protein
MSINYESTQIGEVRSAQISAVPGVGASLLRFTLSWSLHPKRESVYTVFGTYLLVFVATEGSREPRFLGHAIPETAWCEESREGTPVERLLMYNLVLQADQMLVLEHLRQGRGLSFKLDVRGNGHGPSGIRQIYESLQLNVSVSEWIQILRDSCAADVLLVGIQLPLKEENSAASTAVELVRRAHDFLSRGEYDAAVGECRRALESVWSGHKLIELARGARKTLGSGAGDRKSMSKLDRLLALGEAVINFTHPAHHVDDVGDPEIFSRTDAAVAVASTAALVSTLTITAK